MKARRRIWLLFLVPATLIIGLIWLTTRPEPAEPKDWLTALQPVFSLQTNAQGVQPIILLALSNVGPRSLNLDLSWLECRSRADSALFRAELRRSGGPRRSLQLGRGGVTNILVDVFEYQTVATEPLFCCRIHWIESASAREWGLRINRPMYWLGALLGFNWKPPWHEKPLALGDVFTSNIGVADYFSRVYGFTKEGWLEEKKAQRQREEAVRQQTAALPPGVAVHYGSGELPARTPEEKRLREAKNAFALFCQTPTNVVAGSPRPSR